jgi:hypothetical protein
MKNTLIALEDEITAEFNENLENLILFSIYDHEIYRSYDDFTLTIACVFLTCNCMQKETKIYDELVGSLQCNRSLVDDCVTLILKRYYDDSSEQVDQTEISSTSMMETSDTISSNKNSFDVSSLSSVSPCSVFNSFDHQVSEMMLCEDEQSRNDRLSTFMKIGWNGGKKFNSKKKNKSNKKIKKKIKTKKERFFLQRRFRLSKVVKK